MKDLQPKNQYYNEKFLSKDGGNSMEFLDAISYKVDIKDLQQFNSNCCFHQNMEYTPVVIRLLDPRMIEQYNCNFLLQIWNTHGKKCYEKTLQYELHSWNIQHEKLTFRMDEREEGSDWLYVVNLSRVCSVIKVKDYLNDKSYRLSIVSRDILYYANSNSIKMVKIQTDIQDGQTVELTFKKEEVLEYKINEPCKLHSMFENTSSRHAEYVICAVETADNQLDFTRLYFWSADLAEADLEFFQYREVVKRQLPHNDPIIKLEQVCMKDDYQFGVALRESGAVDFYWNYSLVYTSEEGLFKDVDINFDYIFLVASDNSPRFPTFGHEKVKLSWASRISLEVAEKYEYVAEESHKNYYSMIAGSVKIFSAVCLFTTSIFVAHNRVVSLFDVVRGNWVKHFPFTSDVYDICRNEKPNGQISLVVFLKDGTINVIDCSEEEEPQAVLPSSYKVEGKIMKIVSDWKKATTHYILTDDLGNINLYCFRNSKLTNISKLITDLSVDSALCRFFNLSPAIHFLIYNKSKQSISIYATQSNEDDVTVTLEENYQSSGANEKNLRSIASVAVMTENKDFIVLLDDQSIYKFEIKTRKIISEYQHQNIASLLVVDHKNFYSLSNSSKYKEKPGFYYQDINTLMVKEQENGNFFLIDAIVGMNGLLDFNQDSNRIAFLTDYENIKIVPVLHRNTLSFFGMKPRNQYITYRKLHDKLIALDKKNRLTHWSVATGKYIDRVDLKNDFSDFDVWQHTEHDIIYKRDWYHPICLIKCKNKYTEMTDENFYPKDMLTTSLPKNKSFISIEPKTFHLFKIIEIVNESEVKVHFSFVHPVYKVVPGSIQQIYFSMKKQEENYIIEYMLEILTNQRVFIYELQKEPGQELCRWGMVRRINQFPQDINSKSQANYLFSPDLMYYLDYDKSDDKFVIVHTLTQVQTYSVPPGLMNPSREEAREIAMKFKWVDSQRIRVINQDGMEVVVDIHNQFKEVTYGQVPMLEISAYVKETEILQYYFNQGDLPLYDTFGRLKKNYQEFKALYYVEGITTEAELYDQLFTCDFSVKACQDKVVVDLSFTYLHWRMCEQLAENKDYDCKTLGKEELKLLCVNIFPGFKTILHYAYEQMHVIRYIYRLADKEKQCGRNIEIPFIKNIDGVSPLHQCIKEANYKAADLFLERLQNEGIDNHGRVIVQMLPECIRQQIPCIGEYLEKRFIQTTQTREICKGLINYGSNPKCGITYGELWPDTVPLVKRLLCTPKLGAISFDSEILTEILDIPYLHCFDEPISQEFMQVLGETKQLELFDLRSIQCIIDFQWPLIQEFTIKLLFLPFMIFLALFVIYQNVFWGQIDKSDSVLRADLAFQIVLLIFSAYFMFNELRQIVNFGLPYFASSFWNYVSMLTPVFVVLTIALDLSAQDIPFLAAIRAIASLLMWTKLISFLRIFNSTGYLVRTLTTVIYDIRTFLLVLLIIYLGFCEAFLRINEMSDPDAQFVKNYGDALQWVYTLSLGNFQLDTFNSDAQNVTLYLLMCLVTVLVNIIMLNLIVALLSSSFERINEQASQATYQEHARIIAENSNLIPAYQKRRHCPKNKYLFVARDIAQIEEQNDKVDESILKIKELQDATDKLKLTLSLQVDEWNSTLVDIIAKD